MESYKNLVLDFDPKTKKEIVVVHPDIVKFLKPHQVRLTNLKSFYFWLQ